MSSQQSVVPAAACVIVHLPGHFVDLPPMAMEGLMTPAADARTCYVCHDKRRTADVDAAATLIRPQCDSETLKQTLMRALSQGHAEDLGKEVKEEASRLSSGVCVVMLNSDCDGELEAVSDRVLEDLVVICRRCSSLLKDFEHHEQTAARIAEKLRGFLIRHLKTEEEEEDVPSVVSTLCSKPQKFMKKTAARNQDEQQGIIAAFKAFKRSGIVSSKKRGRRKKDLVSPEVMQEEDEDDTSLEESQKEDTEDEESRQEGATSRHSQRIQRRREDGLVIQWGNNKNEEDGKYVEDDDDLSDYSSSAMSKDRSYARRGRGRKITRIVRSASTGKAEGDTGLKFECPFCFRYYIPMSSRIHHCTSYKNKLRCHSCNIFFTSHVRLERHLEVIHLKRKLLTCSMEDCDFTCIAEPTLTMHKHFHILKFSGGEDKQDKQQIKTRQKRVNNEEVVIEDDEHGVVSSPSIADRVSFLLDEKSFLSDGHPLHITTDKIPKNNQDDYKVLRFQDNAKNLENPTILSRRLETNTLRPSKGSNLVLQCPICDVTLVSTKNYQEHIQDVHQLQVSTRVIADDGSIRDSQKGPGSESLTRIVKYYDVKKNSKSAPKGWD
ncbi:hypothetical protein GWK47_012085 [Chionoecetes opilio]|uniref:C2H2-type domain-containing protein n=1 Tax=Chionoecetes opilio TaxID=41210 RepID=A0A8J5CM15_CHIOP|nr:hypothetical protein GWK47_012085 [Chionoecetes opilio]